MFEMTHAEEIRRSSQQRRWHSERARRWNAPLPAALDTSSRAGSSRGRRESNALSCSRADQTQSISHCWHTVIAGPCCLATQSRQTFGVGVFFFPNLLSEGRSSAPPRPPGGNDWKVTLLPASFDSTHIVFSQHTEGWVCSGKEVEAVHYRYKTLSDADCQV